MEATLLERTHRVLTLASDFAAVVRSSWIYRLCLRVWILLTPLRHVCIIVFAVITGTSAESAEERRHRVLAKDQLKHNDVYRDRLLALEIEHFVDVGDALTMTRRQRDHFFQTFLKLDWTRRSGITVKDLFLYCGLRRSRLADVLLPSPPRKESFRRLPDRFEISSLLATLFSFCSLPPAQLLGLVVDTAETDVVVAEILAQDLVYLELVQAAEAASSQGAASGTSLRLQAQIARILVLVIGTLNPNEQKLMSCLRSLYGDGAGINFTSAHGIRHVCDFLQRFPALVYPAFWMQRTLRRRILGHKFWGSMVALRRAWEAAGHSQVFYSVADVLAIGGAPLMPKSAALDKSTASMEQRLSKVLPSSWLLRKRSSMNAQKEEVLGAPPLLQPIDSATLVHETDGVSMAPPKLGSNSAAVTETCAVNGPVNSVFDVAVDIQEYANEKEAWKVTAENLMAAIHLKQQQLDDIQLPAGTTFAYESQRLVRLIAANTLPPADMEAIRKSIVRQYGYHFADFLLQFVAQGGVTAASKTTRGSKKSGVKATGINTTNVWSKMYDPAEKHTFYYNAHTGESQWELPRDAVLSTAPSSKKRKT
ncbi:hypothetical protein ACHHYP_16633 [Achlya hypogyna]|uniref:WW domain-containing protein n=1 Tax=Achlya hypogyna TaxID=1202772 RepID=A0A1V9Y6B1_ACHHY|nr:hypothetical protein ACHHYP_16633 [Achlya hypogyna]